MEESLKAKVGRKVTIIGIIANIFLAAIKFILGIISMSSALIADAIHSLSDLFSDFICYFSLKYSQEPGDEDHPYGHGRIETFGTSVIGILLIFVGIGMIYFIVESLLTDEGVRVPTTVAIYALLISIIVKELLYQYTKIEGKKVKSPILIANAWHHRTDSISSVAALFGVCGAIMGYPILDPIAAIVVAAIIIKAGGEITYEAFQELIDTAVSEEERKVIIAEIIKTEGVRAFHELKSRLISGNVLLEVHVVVQPRISITEGHTIAELVRSRLIEKIPEVHDVIVHADAEDDKERIHYDYIRKEINNTLKEIIENSKLKGLKYKSIIHYLDSVQELELFFNNCPKEVINESGQYAKEIKENIDKTNLFVKSTIYFEPV